MSEPVLDRDGAVDIIVWVVPGASTTELAGRHGDAVRIRVAQPPERGKATQAVATLLGGVLGAPVELIAGATSRRKRFRVSGLDAGAVRRALGL